MQVLTGLNKIVDLQTNILKNIRIMKAFNI
ncbi:hypothetical protein CHRY9293_01750 [Chryseobacterium potabilaquae]|uniref:Uncharacterized protein n=1 Tax=Chryseobacterium potabilaquae TaxID=2675057 RepID=A0A6N4X4V1_9FLAO|nr:hypothetical protein CHRY9293_01750 [Chryseobacterium potabilaquae]